MVLGDFFSVGGCSFSVPSGNSVRNVECLVGPRTVNPNELHEQLTNHDKCAQNSKNFFCTIWRCKI